MKKTRIVLCLIAVNYLAYYPIIAIQNCRMRDEIEQLKKKQSDDLGFATIIRD